MTRDAFAAENHSSGGLFVDVITFSRDRSVARRRAVAHARRRAERPEPVCADQGAGADPQPQLQRGARPLEVSSFSIAFNTTHAYDTPIVRAALPSGAVVSQTSTASAGEISSCSPP